ncbi:putative glycosyl [Erysiphe neolycopersici]|uniref:Putative glycosyl n=1 Tax=Erysiphe neolycopersici TaxID=212602 RepID=A0A420HQD9_9PEZI|nr:putative glycosyl [Erysiphe neolycopersici]
MPSKQNIKNHRQELAALLKIYKDDMLYSGGDDHLDHKLHIFYDFCHEARVPPTQEGWAEAFSTMLIGDARNFYCDNISGRGFSFDTMVKLTRQNYEIDERHLQILSKWYSIS